VRRGLKIEKTIKAQQPEVYKQLKKERKENLSSNYIEKLMENNKGVDEKKCR
jgi:predicted CopG family antitoxin